VTEFLDCIETGRQPIANPRVAPQSLRVIWRLYDTEERDVVADPRSLNPDQFVDGPVVGTTGQVLKAPA